MRLLASTVICVLVCGVVVAAERPPRASLQLESAAPLFAASDLVPGSRRVACTTVRNTGDAVSRVALYAPARRGALARHLRLVVSRGCAGGSELYRGALASFPSTIDAALVEPTLGPGDRRAYRFELTLADDPAAEGESVWWDWRLAVEAAPAATSRAASASARVASDDRCTQIRVRRVRSVRLSRHVRAVLALRPRRDGVIATTGLRARGGRTLLIHRWARVRYQVNGRAAGASRTRPFRKRLHASRFTTGTNRVTVTVQPRKGRTRRTTFRLHVTGNAGVCEVTG